MKTTNGWDVYLKIKELSSKNGDHKPHIHLDDLVQEIGAKKDHIREYLTALHVLDFIKYTDHSKEVFVLTEG